MVSTEGYGIVITDEASGVSQEIKGQDTNKLIIIRLMNQLFDSHGDKSNFANMHERIVLENATSMTLGVQPQPFFRALQAFGKTVWLDSSFVEHFLQSHLSNFPKLGAFRKFFQ